MLLKTLPEVPKVPAPSENSGPEVVPEVTLELPENSDTETFLKSLKFLFFSFVFL